MRTMMRYHLTPDRMAVFHKLTNSKCWQECGAWRTLLHYVWECRLVQRLWKCVWRQIKKLKMDPPLDPVIPLLGVFTMETKTLIPKNISTPMFIAVFCTITKIWKQPKCPSTDEWIKQLWVIYVMGYYLAIKRREKFYPL